MSSDVRYRMENAIQPKDIATGDLIQAQIPFIETVKELAWNTQILMTLPEANERYLTRWEKSLGISSPSPDLEERRRYLIANISSKQKTTSETLEAHSEAFTGLPNRVEVVGSTIRIRFSGGLSDVSISRFRAFIESLIPAHLGTQIILEDTMNNEQYIYAMMGDGHHMITFEPSNELEVG